jgi:hypothetical protein
VAASSLPSTDNPSKADDTQALSEAEFRYHVDRHALRFYGQRISREVALWLIVRSLVERHHAVETGMPVSDVHALYLLSTAKLVLENTVFHARLLLLQRHQLDMESLLAPFTLKGRRLERFKPHTTQSSPMPMIRYRRLVDLSRTPVN